MFLLCVRPCFFPCRQGLWALQRCGECYEVVFSAMRPYNGLAECVWWGYSGNREDFLEEAMAEILRIKLEIAK